MNTLSCKAQLLFSCLTACQSSCLSTCLPDYLPTYRAAFVQIKEKSDGGEVKYYFYTQEFIFFTQCASELCCLFPLLTVQPFSITLSGRLSTCLLRYPIYLCESVHSSMPPNPWISASTGYCCHCSSSLHPKCITFTYN